MVRAVLNERQTSDRDVKSGITFSFQWKLQCKRASIRVENQNCVFVKVMQDSTARLHLFRFDIHFLRQP